MADGEVEVERVGDAVLVTCRMFSPQMDVTCLLEPGDALDLARQVRQLACKAQAARDGKRADTSAVDEALARILDDEP